jgi:hypothetical protein
VLELTAGEKSLKNNRFYSMDGIKRQRVRAKKREKAQAGGIVRGK